MHECLEPLNEGPPGRPQFQRWCHPHLFTDFRSVTLPVWATTSSPSLNKDIGWHHQHYPFYNWYPMTSAFTLQSSISDSGLPSFKNQKGNHIISICQICKHTPLPVPWSLPPGSNKRPGHEVLPPQHRSDIAHLSAPRRLLSSVRQCFLLGLLHRFLNWFCAFHVTVFQSMLYIFYSSESSSLIYISLQFGYCLICLYFDSVKNYFLPIWPGENDQYSYASV